jgi:hypothetical protein
MKAYDYLYSMDDTVDPLDCSDTLKLESYWDQDNIQYAAGDAGEDYYDNHDGWECSWPNTVHLWTAEGTFLGSYMVEMEVVPSFSASKIDG